MQRDLSLLAVASDGTWYVGDTGNRFARRRWTSERCPGSAKRSISARDTLPMVRAEATDEPDNAAKPPQPITVAEARPPRTWPTIA